MNGLSNIFVLFCGNLDEQAYWPIFDAAQALDVPIYIHPREPRRACGK